MEQVRTPRPGKAPADQAAAILDVAVVCIAQRGASRTSMSELSRRSGLSIGGIYHHFPAGKEEIAAATYLEALRRYQTGLLTVLESAIEPKAAIQGAVAYHLRWVQREPDWARVLATQRDNAMRLSSERGSRELNREFARRAVAALRPFIDAGKLQPLPFDVLTAIVIGPCQQFTGQLLAGNATTTSEQATEALAARIWRALAPDAAI